MTQDEKEEYEERAAIMEYCANMTRQEAERRAYNDLLALRKSRRAGR